MAYMYQVRFDIGPDQMDQLQIGASLERVLGYLRTLLPGEPGFLYARAMYSIDDPDATHLLFESVWDTWEDLTAHRTSSLLENKVLREFDTHLTPHDLMVRIFREVD
jgi:hypothetical protein